MDNHKLLSDLGIELRNIKTSGKTTCPKCSHTRKKKTDPCLSVNIVDGLYKCHNCGWFGSVKVNSNNEKKSYSIPVFNNRTDLSEKTVKFFQSRCINQDTLNHFKITNSRMYFPALGGEHESIDFNYFRKGSLVNVKYRGPKKSFMLNKGSELIFYNLDAIVGQETVYVVEGECFTGDAEILTEEGWVRLDLYNHGKVMQVNDDLTSSFVDPICRVEKEFDGRLIEYSNNQKFYSLTTPDHNMVVYNPRTNKFKKEKARDLSVGVHIPRTVVFDGPGVDLTDEQLRLCVAVSADFTFRQSGDLNCALKKDRKKDRLENLLKKVGIPYSLNIDGRGYYSFFIRRGDNPGFLFKKFPKEWISKLSKSQAGVILEEILHWDGNSVPDRNQIEYSSKEMDNAVFVQTLSHLHGYTSTIIDRENDFGKWFKVSILFSKKHSDSQSLLKNKKEISHSGKVYCVQVPSGKILIRQNRCISVSGNCDAMSVHQVGFESVVSVPNGATVSGNSNLEYLDNCIDSFSSAKKIIIATDNDDPGRNLRRELTRRLGAHRCFKVDFGDLKDSNEVLMHKGPEALYEILSDYREMPIDGVISVSDVWDELEGFFKSGLSRGETTGTIREFDKLVSFVPGHTMAITGVPNHGKSLLSNQIMCSLSVNHGWKWAVFSPEHKPLSLYLAKLCEMLLGKRMKMGAGFTDREKELAKNFLNEHFFFIEPEDGDNTLDSIISKAESLVFRKGVRGFILDPWNKIDHNQGKNQSETQYISKALDEIIYFGQKNSVFNIIVAHPTKVKKKANSQLYEVPTMYDIAGSANFFNKVDWGITFYRNFESGLNEIYVQKSKWEHLGKIGSLYCKFNPANGRLGDEMDDPDYSNWLKPKEEQIDITFTRDSFQDLPPVQVIPGEEEEIPF